MTAPHGPGPGPREIRAVHDEHTITVYQAYAPVIGLPAARDGRFPAEWSRERMTWVKPSFLWMMHRSGWGTKPAQECVLAVRLTREGFEEALGRAVPSSYDRDAHVDARAWKRALKASPVRSQWDPERDVLMRALPYRSLQLGLSGEAARAYADRWTVGITDVTPLVRRIHGLVAAGDVAAATALLPQERLFRPGSEGCRETGSGPGAAAVSRPGGPAAP